MIKKINKGLVKHIKLYSRLKVIEKFALFSILFVSIFSVITFYKYTNTAEAIWCSSPSACTVTGAVYGGVQGNGTITSSVVPGVDGNGNYIAYLLLNPDSMYEAKSLSTTANCSASIVGDYAVTGMLSTPGCTVTVTFGLIPTTPPPSATSYLIGVSKSGTGTGTVTSSPSGINCGSVRGCSAAFTRNTYVSLTATAATGSVFAGWSGYSCGYLFMDADYDCTAIFNLNPPPTVTVTATNNINQSNSTSNLIVPYDTSVTISWTSTNAQTCTCTYGPSNLSCGTGVAFIGNLTPAVPINIPANFTATTTINVTCSN